MEHGDHQLHQDHDQGHFEGQFQTGFDTFVMTGDMIIKTTPKVAAQTRPKPDKPATSSVIHIGDHTLVSNSSPDLQELTVNGGTELEVLSVVPSQADVSGYPGFPDIPVELDIPPDDISSEDERYRLGYLVDLDVNNLPPPPAEFLGDFSNAHPTSDVVAEEDGAPVWQMSGLPGDIGRSENCRSSLDEAIMRLENETTSSQPWISQKIPDHAAGVSIEKVLSAERASSSGSLVLTGTSGVRASRSQDDWLQHDDSGVGFVNIDVEGSSTSVEALHCALPGASLNSFDARLCQNKSGEAPLLRQSADDVRHWNNVNLFSTSGADATNVLNSVDRALETESAQSLAERSMYCHEHSSPKHTSEGVEGSRQSSGGQRLLGGGKSSPVRRPPPYPNGTDSSVDLSNPTSYNDVADTNRTQLKDVDHPSACRLAKRLYHLDGFRKSDVSKHLSKKLV